MTREEVYEEIEEVFGLVPSFFKLIPDNTLEAEWRLLKRVEVEDGAIPAKYRDLIGLAVSAAVKCPYCTFYSMEAAKIDGATGAEIQDALEFTKSTVGWSAYFAGMQMDLTQFKMEILDAMEFIRSSRGCPQPSNL